MKFAASAILLALQSSAFVGSAPAETEAAFEMLRAATVVDKAIEQYKKGGPEYVDQPDCVDVPAGYYVWCIQYAKKQKDSILTVHPVLPVPARTGDVDSENLDGAVAALYEVIDSCPAFGDLQLSTYDWDNAGDGENVIKTSLVKDFYYRNCSYSKGKKGKKHGRELGGGKKCKRVRVFCGTQVAEEDL